MSQVIKLQQVIKITALARSTVYRHIADGKFPQPIKLGERASGWLLSEVESWLDQRIQARNAQGDS